MITHRTPPSVRSIWIVTWATLLLAPSLAWGLALGGLELRSGLNQPLSLRIALHATAAESLDDLRVSLADEAAFSRAGLDRPHLLSSLRFEVTSDPAGSHYIEITTRESVREPYLSFILEVAGPNGRLQRAYTALLEAPVG